MSFRIHVASRQAKSDEPNCLRFTEILVVQVPCLSITSLGVV
jgi:hypothetical protein